MSLQDQIANLEAEKGYQHHQDAIDKLEDQIIDLVDQYLLSTSPEYRADSTEYERLDDLITHALTLKEYVLALNKSVKETRGAAGAQVGDFFIPGEIGTIGSSIQTRIATQAQQEASGIFNRIEDGNKETLHVKETHMTDLFAGLDVIFDALKISLGRKGPDLTSGIAAIDHALQSGNIKKALEECWNIVSLIDPEGLERQIEDMRNKIRNSIAQERANYF